MEIYLVGGAVRDEILGQPVKDRDWVVVGGTEQEMLAKNFTRVGADFPVYLCTTTKEEYALARQERKSGTGYMGFSCDASPSVTLEEDLSRRDLTINAIAKSASGDLIDPYNGISDIQHRVLRHVSSSFAEDPLRVLRVARFAARYSILGFNVHKETMQLMREIVLRGEMRTLTTERIWKEIMSAFQTPKPSVFFTTLRACGALQELLPEVDNLFGVPQPEQHHPEIDTGSHVMLAVDWAAAKFNNPIISWATLLHDLGKGLTPSACWPKHHGHEQAGVPLVRQVGERLKVPRDYRKLALSVCEWHLHCHRINEMRPGKIWQLLKNLDALRNPEQVTLFARACQADASGRLGLEDRPYPQADFLLGCLSAANQVDTKVLTEQGISGVKFGELLDSMRIRAISVAKKSVLSMSV